MIVEKTEKGAENIIFVYTTCRDYDEARSIGLSAINNKFAACADYWEISSIYPWQGVIQDVVQYMLMLTTERDMGDALIKHIEAIHSYSTPMIACLDVPKMNLDYKFWAKNTLRAQGDYISEKEGREKTEYEQEDGYHPGKLK